MSWRQTSPYISASRSLIAIVLLLIVFSPRCLALEAGHYDGQNTSYSMLANAIRSADRKIEFTELDKVCIGVRKVNKTGSSSDEIFFARDQLRNFLSSEKHKDVLAARMWPHDLNAVKEYALGFGYKRVIIYNYRLLGIELFYDSDSAKNMPKRRYSQSGI